MIEVVSIQLGKTVDSRTDKNSCNICISAIPGDQICRQGYKDVFTPCLVRLNGNDQWFV